MVTEIAQFRAKPGQADKMREGLSRARAILAQSRGYRGSTFLQGIEDPQRIVLINQWDDVESHMKGFREGPHFAEWRSHFGEFIDGAPDMIHFNAFAGPD